MAETVIRRHPEFRGRRDAILSAIKKLVSEGAAPRPASPPPKPTANGNGHAKVFTTSPRLATPVRDESSNVVPAPAPKTAPLDELTLLYLEVGRLVVQKHMDKLPRLLADLA